MKLIDYAIMGGLVAVILLAASGCSSLERLDYVCVDVYADGPWTDSRAEGKGIKLPEGETLTPELAAAICKE